MKRINPQTKIIALKILMNIYFLIFCNYPRGKLGPKGSLKNM